MQTENLFELTYILLDKKSVTAKEMAAHFGVSPRTIYRWVDALNLAGVPVYTSKGRGGGIFLSEKYALDKTVFTDEEKKELLAGVQAVNSLSGIPSTHSAVSKLRSLIGNIPEINVKDKSNWIQIDFEPWSSKGTEVQELFLKLKDAIFAEQQVSFDYYSMHGESEGRNVQPWKLLFKNQAWYLYGWCNKANEERFFKLNRMRNLTLLSKPVTHFYKDQPHLEQLQQEAVAFKMLDVVLEVNEQFLPTILDEFEAVSVENAETGQNERAAFGSGGNSDDSSIFRTGSGQAQPGNKKRITLKMPDFPWLEYTLLGYADEVTVLEPPDLRTRLKKRIDHMRQNYSD
ncbi:MAG: YafY family transcriptional regulator [Spirochaetaceae bacterium]|nr:YafY family transcriptional regulator [Spirochaetaceae bacterium]